MPARFATALSLLLLVFALPHAAFASIIITPTTYPGGNLGVQTWTKAEGPYIIDGTVSERFGTLTIEPGTVIKFTPGSSFSLHADIHANITGTAEDPIYFTSIKDDSVGGDTNGDGTASAPAAGDWGFVSLGSGSWNSSLQLSYAKFRYGGGTAAGAGAGVTVYPSLILTYWWYSGSPGITYDLSHIETSYGKTGALVLVGSSNTLNITESSFRDNSDYGLYKYRDPFLTNPDRSGTLNATDDWWGSDTGPSNPTLNSGGAGNAVSGNHLTISPWLSADPLPDPVTAPQYQDCCSNVVFIPGIKGSILKSGSETLWPADTSGTDISKLALDVQGNSVNPIVVDGILPSFKIHIPILGDVGPEVYSGLITFMNGLTSINPTTGTSTINAWEALPYDWRYAPDYVVAHDVETPNGPVSMVSEVERMAASSATGKVTVVAHSMGGLVGKALIKALSDKGEADLIDSFVMIASPELGTPQAIASLLHGDNEGIPGKKLIPNLVTTKSAVRAVGINFPSTYSLLPSPQYFNAVTDPVIAFGNILFTQAWRDFWGNSISAYAPYVQFLTGTGVTRSHPAYNDTHIPEVLNSDLVSWANGFHNEYDTYQFPSNIRVVELAGWGVPTTKAVDYTTWHLTQSYDTLSTVEGDGVVVYPSAIAAGGEKYFFNLSLFNKNESNDVDHGTLFSAQPILTFIRDTVTKNPSFGDISYLTSTKPPLSEVGTQLRVSTHSPVILGAYDSFGNFTGIYPNQDMTAPFLYVQEDIPGSSFSVSGDNQYLYLPKEGAYSVVYKGTGNGSTTVNVETFSNDSASPVSTYSDIPTTQQTKASLNIDSTAPQNPHLQVDSNGDGQTDTYVAPDSQNLSLNELLQNLTTTVQNLDVKDRLKKQLLSRITALQKKLDRKAQRQSVILSNLEAQIERQANRNKIDTNAAAELTTLIDELIASSADIPLDPVLLADLESRISNLDVSKQVKKSLLVKIDRLKNLAVIERSLDAFMRLINRKGDKGQMADGDVQNVLNLLDQIENAL